MRYYGGKSKLLDFIYDTAINIQKNPVIFDMFAGTTTVSRHFKENGCKVYTNDILTFSFYRSTSYIDLNTRPSFSAFKNDCFDPIKYLNNLESKADFITRNYSPYKGNLRQYVSVENAMKIDSSRIKIEEWFEKNLINFYEYAYLITCLIESINLISNVTGTYAAYLKNWDSRALKKLKLNHLDIKNNNHVNFSFNEDSNNLSIPKDVDICYLDPPYNGRQYTSNYFFLELIATGWFKNKVTPTGVTGIVKYDDKKSKYCSKVKARETLNDLLEKIDSPYVMLSYNDEGIVSHDDIKSDMSKYGQVTKVTLDHKRYRAINQDGSHSKTKESIFVLKRN